MKITETKTHIEISISIENSLDTSIEKLSFLDENKHLIEKNIFKVASILKSINKIVKFGHKNDLQVNDSKIKKITSLSRNIERFLVS